VGRLVAEKKPALLVEAFLAALDELPAAAQLVFVGDGPLRAGLERRVAAAGAHGRVVFLGALTGFDDLERVYAAALASVLPGSAGLALIQSHWFGVPTIVARDGAHGPEIEAADAEHNTVFVEPDSVDALRAALVRVVAVDHERWRARRAEIAAACVRRYSLEATAQALVRAVDGVAR
jgi:glycosyltransferase involved in cell wall biosynthesis